MRPLLVVCALALVPALARAEVFGLYGFGPRAASMGGAMTAEVNDYTAVFYNPAALVDRQDVNVGVHVQWYRMVSDVKATESQKPLDLSQSNAPDSVGTSVGLLFPLVGKVRNRLALGVGIYLPTGVLLRLNSPPASAPYWYRYHGSPERLELHVGAGVRILDWLKVGLGIQVLSDLIGNGANVKVDLFSKQVQSGDINAYLGTRVAPVFSVHLSPFRRLRLGATFKWEMKLVYVIPATVDLVGVGTLGLNVSGVSHYTPHTLNFGASFDVTKDFTVSAEAEWQNWSAAPSPYMAISIDVSGRTVDALGLGQALDVKSELEQPGFADTLGARLGAEYRLSDRFAARAGGFLRPTPVPRQDTTGTNLLDNTALGVTAGIGFNFPDPLEILSRPLQIDLAAQAQFVLPRDAKKDPLDDQPAYTYRANVYGVTAAMRYDF